MPQFNYPATEVFQGSTRRVVWSQEEYDAALAEGCTEVPADEPVVEPAVEQIQEPEPVARRGPGRPRKEVIGVDVG